MDGSTPGITVEQDPWALPLDQLDPSQAELFQTGVHYEYFRRLREEDPVHFTKDSAFGPYWSVTKFNDIVTVDTRHDIFSSERDIVIGDQPEGFAPAMFIAMESAGRQAASARPPARRRAGAGGSALVRRGGHGGARAGVHECLGGDDIGRAAGAAPPPRPPFDFISPMAHSPTRGI